MNTQLIMTKCSKCRRIKVNSNWLPEPKFLAHDAIYTHAYCPECLEQELAMVENYTLDAPISVTAPLLTTRFAYA